MVLSQCSSRKNQQWHIPLSSDGERGVGGEGGHGGAASGGCSTPEGSHCPGGQPPPREGVTSTPEGNHPPAGGAAAPAKPTPAGTGAIILRTAVSLACWVIGGGMRQECRSSGGHRDYDRSGGDAAQESQGQAALGLADAAAS